MKSVRPYGPSASVILIAVAYAEAPEADKLGSECRPTSSEDPVLNQALADHLLEDTARYWLKWLSQCTYTGRWREFVQRSALTIKVRGPLIRLLAVLYRSRACSSSRSRRLAPLSLLQLSPYRRISTALAGTGTTGDAQTRASSNKRRTDSGKRRYSWLRDSSFSIYALLRLGFTAEADGQQSFCLRPLHRLT